MTNDFRLKALGQVKGKIEEFLSNDASYWHSGEVAWSLLSITDFYYERYVETKKQEPSENELDLIRWLCSLSELYWYSLGEFDRAHTIGQALRELTSRWDPTKHDRVGILPSMTIFGH